MATAWHDATEYLLRKMAGDAAQTGVWVVDCRGAMPDLADSDDEIHGTSDGFAKVAAWFKAVLDQVTAPGTV